MAKKQKNRTSSSRQSEARSRRHRGRGRRADGGNASSSVADHTPSPSTLSWALGAGGVLVAVLGFWMVAQGSITLAPILLVLAYLVLFPLALVR